MQDESILNLLFTEKEVNEVSDKIIKSTIEKIKSQLSGDFYDKMSEFIYEHYLNASDAIQKDLIGKITEEFINDPKDCKFLKLRQKLFNENKEELVSILTDEAINKSIEKLVFGFSDESYYFKWRWEDAVVKLIEKNWYNLQNNGRINNNLLSKIDQLRQKNMELQNEINELKSELN